MKGITDAMPEGRMEGQWVDRKTGIGNWMTSIN
jgi:hypothetical protein